MSLPYATAEFGGVGGTIKERNEDFVVEEVALYEPVGAGEHVYAFVEKSGLTTFDLVSLVARGLGISEREVGFAGMKDARAVTRQLVSIRTTDEEAVQKLSIAGVKVLWTARHGNKLRLGHLKGNRFVIRIRDVEPTGVTKIVPILKLLERRGMPNFFGEQRFGRRGNNDKLGAALVRQDNKELAHLLLGDPMKGIDDPQQMEARKRFDEGKWDESMKAWPRRCGLERRLLHQVIKTGKASGAGRVLDEKLRRLFVSALQSRVFNSVLARRMDSYDRLLAGDWAEKAENGACFPVEDVEKESPRCEAWEVSPTGPLIGFRVSQATEEAGLIEQAAFDEFALRPEMFKVPGYHRVKGARRALRVRPEGLEYSAGVDEHGGYIELKFTLPAGAFATVLLSEVMKSEENQPAEAEGGEAGMEEGDAEHSSGDAEHPLGAVEREEE
jgi:tRNA pseudouridine13 synthase